eukprot:gnl/TRDRNA2_/TRDRNA2_196930_c0_seq1.p1 gnl/TRDRNA2_/TRDRNA2_196930_c0~~gnl/TRDRNA2_/TRDRNA2_196930_c0_seq1.p1  ORF type:complete len:103 (+),score=18.81 gnl/TRDRNA2_/TRDRNA2_196930_c0_seq1:65-373(+)
MPVGKELSVEPIDETHLFYVFCAAAYASWDAVLQVTRRPMAICSFCLLLATIAEASSGDSDYKLEALMNGCSCSSESNLGCGASTPASLPLEPLSKSCMRVS